MICHNWTGSMKAAIDTRIDEFLIGDAIIQLPCWFSHYIDNVTQQNLVIIRINNLRKFCRGWTTDKTIRKLSAQKMLRVYETNKFTCGTEMNRLLLVVFLYLRFEKILWSLQGLEQLDMRESRIAVSLSCHLHSDTVEDEQHKKKSHCLFSKFTYLRVETIFEDSFKNLNLFLLGTQYLQLHVVWNNYSVTGRPLPCNGHSFENLNVSWWDVKMLYLMAGYLLNGWQLAKMKTSIPDMSLPWNL